MFIIWFSSCMYILENNKAHLFHCLFFAVLPKIVANIRKEHQSEKYEKYFISDFWNQRSDF